MTESFDGKKLWVRKNSKFHTWLNSQGLLENIDQNKNFLYIGEIYDSLLRNNEDIINFNDKESFYFNHYALKNYVEAALPEINRKEMFIDFLRLYFDELYQYIYNKQSSIVDILNPLITHKDFLQLIADTYGVNYEDVTIFSEICIRLFLHAMPGLIKAKGSFSTFYLIFKILLGATTNRINIYQLWHEKTLTGNWYEYERELLNIWNLEESQLVSLLKTAGGDIISVPYSGDIYDVALSTLATISDGAGYGFYVNIQERFNSLDLNNYLLTTHYVLEVDVTSQPMMNTMIWDDIFHNLLNIFEMFRPASRVAHYGVLIAPYSDWSGEWFEMYPEYSVSYKTRFNSIFNRDIDSYIFSQNNPITVWEFNHPLLTYNILCQVYNSNNEQVIPNKIEYLTADKVRITFSQETAGYAILKIITKQKFFMIGSETIFEHNLAELPIIGARSLTNYTIPNTQIITNSDNTLISNFSDNQIAHTDMLVDSDYIHFQEVPATKWIINHNAGYAANLIMVYDINKNVIYPNKINNIDDKLLEIEFFEANAGYVTINHIGNPISAATEITILKSYDTYFKFGVDSWNDYDHFSDLKNPILTAPITRFWDDEEYLYLQCILPERAIINIKEVGIFDKFNRLIFYSKIIGLLKTDGIYLKFHYRIKK